MLAKRPNNVDNTDISNSEKNEMTRITQ